MGNFIVLNNYLIISVLEEEHEGIENNIQFCMVAICLAFSYFRDSCSPLGDHTNLYARIVHKGF